MTKSAAIGTGPLLGMLGLLTVVEIAAIDIYIPALPHLQRMLGVDAAQAGLTMSIFLAALAAGQLLYGPLSDHFGRRRPLLLGIVVYIVGSLLPLLAPTFHGFLFARFLQAMGAAAGLVIPRAIVADRFDGPRAARAYSFLMQMLGIAATVAPLLGGFLVTTRGWESIFYTMSGLGLLCLVLVGRFLPETLPAHRRSSGRLKQQLIEGVGFMKDRVFLWSGIAMACSIASMFSLLTNSAFVFVDQFGWPLKTYTLMYGGCALTFFVAATINTWALKHRSELWLLWRAIPLQAALGIGLLALSTRADPSAILAAALMIGVLGNLGFIAGNLNAIAMARVRQSAGSGASLLGVSQYALSALAGTVSAAIANPVPLVAMAHTVFTLCSLSALCFAAAGIRVNAGMNSSSLRT